MNDGESVARASGFQSKLLGDFEPSQQGLGDAVKWAVGSSLVSVAAFAGPFVLPLFRPLQDEDNRIVFYGFFFLSGGLMALVALFFLLYARRHRHRRLFLFQEGYVEIVGDRTVAKVRWQDVDEFYVINNGWAFGILTKEGKEHRVYVWSFSGQQELVQRITDSLTKVMVDDLVQRIQAGETVNFGRIDANEKGITIQRHKYKSPKAISFYKGPKPTGIHGKYVGFAEEATSQLPWAEVQGVYQDEASAMYIKTIGKKARLNCLPVDVPNVLFLPEIARKIQPTMS